MKWRIGAVVGVCMVVMAGCSAHRVVSHRLSTNMDSVARLSAERAFVEHRSRSIELEWWGDAVGHLPMVSVDSVVSDSAPSGRGGIRIQIDDRIRTHADEEMTNNVRMKQTRYEDDSASPNTTRWWWMRWVAVAAVVVMVVWYGLRCMR